MKKKVIQYLWWIDPYEIMNSWDVQRVMDVKGLVDELLEDDFMKLSLEADERLNRIPPVTKEDWEAHEEIRALQKQLSIKLKLIIH